MYLGERQIGDGDHLEFNYLISRLIAVKLIEQKLNIDCSHVSIDCNVTMEWYDLEQELEWFLETSQIGTLQDSNEGWHITFNQLESINVVDKESVDLWKEEFVLSFKESELYEYMDEELAWICSDTIRIPTLFLYCPLYELYKFLIEEHLLLETILKK